MKKLALIAIVITAILLVAGWAFWPKSKPAFPNAGLEISSKGHISSTCGFYMPEADLSKQGLAVKMEIKDMTTKVDGHEFHASWTVRHKAKSDVYHLKLTMDGATTQRTVEYSGTPVVLFEGPLRVVLQDVPR